MIFMYCFFLSGNVGESEEVAALQRESEMDFQDFLNELPKDYLENRDKIKLSDESSDSETEETGEKSSKRLHSDDEQPGRSDAGQSTSRDTKSSKKLKIDEDFSPASSSSEDDEDTIQEQEKVEGVQDYKLEINDLEAENEMSIEELRKKYSGPPPAFDESEMQVSESEESSAESGNDEESLSGSDDDETSVLNEDIQDVGLKSLLDESTTQEVDEMKAPEDNDLINDAAKIAESIQPKGNTLSSTSVSNFTQ